MNIKICICTHKQTELPKHEYFLPLQVGTSLNCEIPSFFHDNSGDNISIKNKNYCELTGHYWMWKNLKNVDLIGLNHYRRYFDFSTNGHRFVPYRRFVDVSEFLKSKYNFPDLESIFVDFDIILPTSRNYPYSVSTQYSMAHIIDDWIILKEIIAELSPEYIPAFKKTMEQSNRLSNYNMFITKWCYFEEYSEWLFKILFEVERRCKISAYPTQARIFGYMSERLINVYCEYRHLRIKKIPLIVPIDNYNPTMNPGYLKYNWWKLRNNIAYKISIL